MNNDIIIKMCSFAFAMSVIGVCTLGICPAFAIMGLSVGIVLKNKGVNLDEKCAKKIKSANILAAAALVLFAADIVLAYIFLV